MRTIVKVCFLSFCSFLFLSLLVSFSVFEKKCERKLARSCVRLYINFLWEGVGGVVSQPRRGKDFIIEKSILSREQHSFIICFRLLTAALLRFLISSLWNDYETL